MYVLYPPIGEECDSRKVYLSGFIEDRISHSMYVQETGRAGRDGALYIVCFALSWGEVTSGRSAPQKL